MGNSPPLLACTRCHETAARFAIEDAAWASLGPVDGAQVVRSIIEDRILQPGAPPVSRGQAEPVEVSVAAAAEWRPFAAAAPAVERSIPRPAPLEARLQSARQYATA